MNLKELPFPIRLYWDLTPTPAAEEIDYREVSAQVADAKFFTLSLLDNGETISDACLTVLERMKGEPVAIALTVSRTACNAPTITLLAGLKVKELLVDVSSKDDLHFIAKRIADQQNGAITIGASVQVTAENYRDIPEVVRFCADHAITRIVFPMQRVTGQSGCFYIKHREGKELSQRLSAIPLDALRITIHDPFLWKIFYPALSFPGGGCQAANSMAYIAPDGKVLPCPTMPVVLGDLKETPLKEILTSAVKKDLVKQLRQAPDACRECEELSGCMGGCSGRVYELTGSMMQQDPACK